MPNLNFKCIRSTMLPAIGLYMSIPYSSDSDFDSLGLFQTKLLLKRGVARTLKGSTCARENFACRSCHSDRR